MERKSNSPTKKKKTIQQNSEGEDKNVDNKTYNSKLNIFHTHFII